MDAAVYKKLMDIENQRENPSQNAIGQDVVSIGEDFYTRLWREGRPVNQYTQGSALTANTLTNGGSSLAASPGCILYPTVISVCTDVDAMVMIRYTAKVLQAGVSSDGKLFDIGYVKAGTPFIIYPKGMVILEGGDITILAKSATAGNLYGSIQGLEVTV